MARRKNATFTLDKAHYNTANQSDSANRLLLEGFYYGLDAKFPGNTPVPIPPQSNIHPTHPLTTQAFICADYVARVIAPMALSAAGLSTVAAKLKKLRKVTDAQTCETAENALIDAEKRCDDAQQARMLESPEMPPMDPARMSLDADAFAAYMVKWEKTVSEAFAKHTAEADAYHALLRVVSDVLVYAGRTCYDAQRAAHAKKPKDMRECAYGAGLQAGQAVANAAELDNAATWEAVNEMLQAL